MRYHQTLQFCRFMWSRSQISRGWICRNGYAVLAWRWSCCDLDFHCWDSYHDSTVLFMVCISTPWVLSYAGYCRYRSIVKDTWYRHFCALVTSTFQLMGCILYLGAEWHVSFVHLPTNVSQQSTITNVYNTDSVLLLFYSSQDWKWPPMFDSYWKIKYFWLIFIGCNFIWIAIPLYIYSYSLQQMKKQFSKHKIN